MFVTPYVYNKKKLLDTSCVLYASICLIRAASFYNSTGINWRTFLLHKTGQNRTKNGEHKITNKKTKLSSKKMD